MKHLMISLGIAGFMLASRTLAQPAPAPDQPTKLEDRALPDRADPTKARALPVPGGLTADEVARRTVRASAMVRARQAELDAARAKVDQTTIQFFPRLTLKATYTHLSPVTSSFGGGALVGAANPGPITTGPCPGGVGTCVLDSQGVPVGAAAFAIQTLQDTYDLSASLTVPISDYVLRLSHAAASSSASKRAAEINVRAERLKVENDARGLYYSWLRARGAVVYAKKSLEQVKARLGDAKSAFALGTISKADLLRMEALAANTEVVVKQAESFETLTVQQLALYMGDKTPRDYQVGEDLLSPVRAPVTGSLASLIAEAHANRLEVKVLSETSRALRRGASAVSAGSLPRIDAFAGTDYANPNQRFFPQQRRWDLTWQVGVAATWTVGDTFANNAAASELEADARVVEAQREGLRDGIQQEVTAAWLDRDKADVALEATARALTAATEAYRVATDLYKVGRATTTELIDAESEVLIAQLKYLDVLIDLKIANVRLRHAVGRDIGR